MRSDWVGGVKKRPKGIVPERLNQSYCTVISIFNKMLRSSYLGRSIVIVRELACGVTHVPCSNPAGVGIRV